jgi:hypothetical protein
MLVLDRFAECRFAIGIPSEVSLFKENVKGRELTAIFFSSLFSWMSEICFSMRLL